MNPLRILHITHSLNIGGLERVVVDLAKGFKKKGHVVSICCLDGKDPLGIEAERVGVKVFPLNKKPGIAWSLPHRIAEIIKAEQINLIHTHNEAGLIYGSTAALFAGVRRIVHTEHGKESSYDRKKVIRIIERYLLRKVNGVVAVSEDLRTKIVNWHGLQNDKIHVISNGIDIVSFGRKEARKVKRSKMGFKDENFVIGNVASLLFLKNHNFLLGIFRELLKELPTLKLVLIGDGPLRGDLEFSAMKMGISNNVLFLGPRKDVVELLPILDLFVLPSLTEGISLSLLEAMAAGIPVVASAVGGNSEIIESWKNGFLIPLESEEEWVRTMKTIIQNIDLRRSVSKMAEQTVAQRFSLTMMMDRYERLYHMVNKEQ